MAKKNGASGNSRVLLIGLDSADADLIERWASEGYLPTFAKLRRQGAWGRLGTTAEIMHVSAWPSLYTGTTPGHHGMYHAYQVRAGEQGVLRTRAEWCAQAPFWKFLDDAGRKCVVMDAFMDYPLPGFGGVQILEYGTWTWFGVPTARPKRLLREIVRHFGPYPAPEHAQVLTVPDPRWFRDRLVSGAMTKSKAVRWLLKENTWDMAFVTFGEPHGAGHYLWHVDDPSFPAHPGALAAGVEHPLRDVYVAVDQAIGEILSELDDSVTLMIASGDGMGPNYSCAHMMPELLSKLGLFSSPNVGGDGVDGPSAGGGAAKRSLLSSVRQTIPLSARQAVTRCLPRSVHYRMSMKWVNADIDWGRSKVFCIPNSNEGYLRVNLRGREPQGIVEPGADYQELLGSLREEVAAALNPVNGQRAAERVVLTDDVFPGDRRCDLPDLVATWNDEARLLSQIESPKAGRLHGKAGYETSPYYTGNHRPNAFVLARGPRIAEGQALHGGHIIDLAPTILAILGVDPPPHFEGRAWEACFAP